VNDLTEREHQGGEGGGMRIGLLTLALEGNDRRDDASQLCGRVSVGTRGKKERE